jgi:exonuclease III
MTFKFMTYNILDGGINRENLILQVLKASQPDAVILQEVTNPNIIQNFAKVLEMKLFLAQGNSRRYLALLSRFPIIFQQNIHPFPPIKHTILEATIEYAPNQHLHLFGVHLVPHFFVAFEWWRAWEIKVTLQRAIQKHSEPCLIAGDFNAVAPQDRVIKQGLPLFLKIMLWLQGGRIFHQVISKTLSAGFTDCYRLVNERKEGFTLPAPDPHIRLDYIFSNGKLKANLQKCYVVSEPSSVRQASDHLPVVAEFNI